MTGIIVVETPAIGRDNASELSVRARARFRNNRAFHDLRGWTSNVHGDILSVKS